MLMKLGSEARQYYYFLYRGYQRHRGLRMVVTDMTATILQGIQLPMSSATVLSAQNISRSWKSWKCTAKGCTNNSTMTTTENPKRHNSKGTAKINSHSTKAD